MSPTRPNARTQPTQTGPRRGQTACTGALAKTPSRYLVLARALWYYSYRQRLCKKALVYSHLRIGEVPDASALTDVALAGTEPLRWPTGTRADLASESMFTYGPTRNAGQRLEDRRRSRATPHRRQPAVATTMFR
jgi:hypothetical protein